jgi:hypothetical protein
MLNEVWQLARAKERVGLSTERTHPRIKAPGKTSGPCLRVRLAADGRTVAVESVADNEWPGFWTVMEGNMNSFPFIRVTRPLLDLGKDDVAWTQLGFDADGKRGRVSRKPDVGAVLKSLCGRVEPSIDEDWATAYSNKAGELGQCGSGHADRFAALVGFAHAFQVAAEDPIKLLKDIARIAVEATCDGRIQGAGVDAVEMLLVGKGPPRDIGERPAMKVQLAFDLADDHEFSVRLYSAETQRHLIQTLPRKDGGPISQCSLTGLNEPRQNGPFPKVRLPVLNKDFPLFSMFSDAACNTRYGMTDSSAVPVSQSASAQMADALTEILAASRQGKSWRGVASGMFERRAGKTLEKFDLLVAYPETRPDLDAGVVAMFGQDEQTVRAQFDADTAVVCQALDGIAQAAPASKLNVLIFRKVSEGQAQVVMAESPTVTEVIVAARRWSEAAANVPEVAIPLPPAEKGRPPVDANPLTPYPDQVVRLLSEQWARQGQQAIKLPGVGLGDVLHLMLRTPGRWESARDRMLDSWVSRLSPLLIGIGGQLPRSHLDRKPWNGYPGRSRQSALRGVAVAGILLHAQNRLKEDYMSSAAFDIGQFLRLADILHKDYCIVVRKGSLPPSLIGNAMMPTAAENPRRAVADLYDRMRVYAGWAQTARDPTDALGNDERLIAVRQARKTLRRYEPLAARLASATLPERCDNAMKAEMLLGYLAKIQDTLPTDKEQDGE